VLCVACAQRCACGDHCAVCSGCGCAGRRAGARGLCVCTLHASVRCVGCGRVLFSVPLCWAGLVSSRVYARACLWCDGSGERGASRHVRGVACWACENVKNLVCDIRATYDVRIAGAVSSAVSRVLCRSIAIAALCCRVCVAALRCGCCMTAQRCVGLCFFVVDCSCVCVSLRCAHACVNAASQCGSGVARVC
jgi:hypothetical protein